MWIRVRIKLFTLMRIRILLLNKVMQICDHWSPGTLGLHFEPPALHCERPRLHFEPLKLLNDYFNADPDPVFHLMQILDPDVSPSPDPDPQPCKGAISGTIIIYKKIKKCTSSVLIKGEV
jgi:hypothetical protein